MSDFTLGNRKLEIYNAEKSTLLDSDAETTIVRTELYNPNNDTIYLFAANVNGSTNYMDRGNLKISSFKLTRGGTVVKNLVAAKNGAAVGMVDLASGNEFHPNKGASNFIAGSVTGKAPGDVAAVSATATYDAGEEPPTPPPTPTGDWVGLFPDFVHHICVVAPCSQQTADVYNGAKAKLEEAGYTVTLSPEVTSATELSAAQKAANLTAAWQNTDYDLIIAIRGGLGGENTFAQLDPSALTREVPFIGFSNISCLLNPLEKCGVKQLISGPSLGALYSYPVPKTSRDLLCKLVAKEPVSTSVQLTAKRALAKVVTGKPLGGHWPSIALNNAKDLPDCTGRIVFLEIDSGYNLASAKSNFDSLKGKWNLDDAAAIVVAEVLISGSSDEMIQYITDNVTCPVYSGYLMGHQKGGVDFFAVDFGRYMTITPEGVITYEDADYEPPVPTPAVAAKVTGASGTVDEGPFACTLTVTDPASGWTAKWYDGSAYTLDAAPEHDTEGVYEDSVMVMADGYLDFYGTGVVKITAAPVPPGPIPGTDPRAEMSKNDFGYLVDITVLYDPGANVISDFPALVRLSPSGISGFDYAYFKSATGADLAFYDAEGNHLPHEIDTWNTSGESLVWVKIPTLAKNMVITACFGNDSLTVQPDPTVVWSNYALVWHFGDHLTDSTGHNLAYTLGKATTVSGEPLGQCVSVKTGEASVPSPFPYLTSASRFSVSVWARNTATGPNFFSIVSTKETDDGETGFLLGNLQATMGAYGSGNSYLKGGWDPNKFHYASGWHLMYAAYDDTSVRGAQDGLQSTGTITPVQANSLDLALGGMSGENFDNPNYKCKFNNADSGQFKGGYVDEVRLANGQITTAYNLADYTCVQSPATFFLFGSCRENVPVEDYEVSIVASADADEKTGSHGVFTVSRPSDKTEKQVKVNYTIGGTAVAGREYEQLTGLLVIPAGEATGTIDVTPLPSPFVVRDTTVVVTLAEGGYHIDEDHSVATVTVRNGNELLPYWEYHAAGKYYTDGVVSLGRNGTTGHDPKGFLMVSEPPDGLAYTLDFDKPVRICDDSTGMVGAEESAITSVNNVDGSALSAAWKQAIRGFVYPSGLTGSVSGPKNLNYVEGTITMPVGVTGGTVNYLGASGQGITFVLQSPFALGSGVFRNSKILEIVNGHHMQGAIAGNAFYSSLQSYTGAVLDFSGVTTIADTCISGNNTYIKTGVRIRLGENFLHTASIFGQNGAAIREIEGFPSPVLDRTACFKQCSFVGCGEECTLPEGVKEIADSSFLNSTGFVSIVSMAATNVLANAWSGFKGLKSISFKTKARMGVLGNSAFAAPQLTRVEFNGAAPDPANVGTIFATLPEKQVTVYVPRDKGWEALADNGVIPGTITKGTRQKIKYQGGLLIMVK